MGRRTKARRNPNDRSRRADERTAPAQGRRTGPGRWTQLGWESGSTCAPVAGAVRPRSLQRMVVGASLPRVSDFDAAFEAQQGETGPDVRHLMDIPAVEVISRAAVLLMSAAAEQLGLGDPDPDNPAHRDLDQARTLITALAGLVNASAPDLGPHAAAFRDGLAGLQGAFRQYSIHPDEPGQGPGERPSRR